MIREHLQETCEEDLLFADGFDEAIIGIYNDSENHIPRVAYSISKVIEILSKDMSLSEALEYFNFNIEGAHMGPQTPIYIDDLYQREDL